MAGTSANIHIRKEFQRVSQMLASSDCLDLERVLERLVGR